MVWYRLERYSMPFTDRGETMTITGEQTARRTAYQESKGEWIMAFRKMVLVTLLMLLPVIAFANQANGKDAPYFSRMPNSYITESLQ